MTERRRTARSGPFPISSLYFVQSGATRWARQLMAGSDAMTVVSATWLDVASPGRVAARSRWLSWDGDAAGVRELAAAGWPLPPPVEAWEIHDLLGEMSSGTRPCTSCCTQCSSDCCNASC